MYSHKKELWEAINNYTEACGGDISTKTISSKRMNAVVEIEKTVVKMKISHNKKTINLLKGIEAL